MKKYFLICLLFTFTFKLEAQWSVSPYINNPVATNSNHQYSPNSVTDGAGGVIVTYMEQTINGFDIYAQRVNINGNQEWTFNGKVVCSAINDQDEPNIVSDENGGAIIVWRDNRNGSKNIYAQKIDSNGLTKWTTNGVVISNTPSFKREPKIIFDKNGGAIIVWQDMIFGLYVQRVDSSGNLMWNSNGINVCPYNIGNKEIISDGKEGIIITWETNQDIYAQRINSSGIVEWSLNGDSICTLVGYQINPKVVSDNLGGAIITWQDQRNGLDYDVYAQRIDSNGLTKWPTNGVVISATNNHQELPSIVSDGSNGAIITWSDNRFGDYDIYAQRIDSNGTGIWLNNGVSICNYSNNQIESIISSIGLNNIIISWIDYRNGGNIYAQKIDSVGNIEWELGGNAICINSFNKTSINIVSDNTTGAIITWQDARDTWNNGFDVYAQNTTNELINFPVKVSNIPDQREIIVYPNPSNGVFNIKTSDDLGSYETNIYNYLGQKIYSSFNCNLIDISMQDAGIYFFEVKFKRNIIKNKLIKLE